MHALRRIEWVIWNLRSCLTCSKYLHSFHFLSAVCPYFAVQLLQKEKNLAVCIRRFCCQLLPSDILLKLTSGNRILCVSAYLRACKTLVSDLRIYNRLYRTDSVLYRTQLMLRFLCRIRWKHCYYILGRKSGASLQFSISSMYSIRHSFAIVSLCEFILESTAFEPRKVIQSSDKERNTYDIMSVWVTI